MRAAAWRAKGTLDAEGGRRWETMALSSARIRRAWLDGWIEQAVSRHLSGDQGLATFHAKRRADGEPWTSAELDLLAAGCRTAPRAPYPLIADLLGRSHDAVRSKASRCGYGRSAA